MESKVYGFDSLKAIATAPTAASLTGSITFPATTTAPVAGVYPFAPQPQPATTITYWPSYPAPIMQPHACPVCKGRETVEAGFYRDVAEDKGPQKCRGCQGRGLIYLP